MINFRFILTLLNLFVKIYTLLLIYLNVWWHCLDVFNSIYDHNSVMKGLFSHRFMTDMFSGLNCIDITRKIIHLWKNNCENALYHDALCGDKFHHSTFLYSFRLITHQSFPFMQDLLVFARPQYISKCLNVTGGAWKRNVDLNETNDGR